VLGPKVLDLDTVPKSDRVFLSLCADMVAREFQLGYESTRRSEEQQQSTFVGELLEKTLVQPLKPRGGKHDDASAPSTRAVKDGQLGVTSSAVSDSFSTATERFMQLTGSTSAAVLDLRSFRCPRKRPTSSGGTEKAFSGSVTPGAANSNVFHNIHNSASKMTGSRLFQKGTLEGENLFQSGNTGKIYLMSASGDVEWSKIIEEEAETLGHAVCRSLTSFYEVSTEKESSDILYAYCCACRLGSRASKPALVSPACPASCLWKWPLHVWFQSLMTALRHYWSS
jgi:hypothetical protein